MFIIYKQTNIGTHANVIKIYHNYMEQYVWAPPQLGCDMPRQACLLHMGHLKGP